MAYKNNHFVPQLILRRFGEEISTYNIKTGEYRHGQQTAEVFSKYEFYPIELEKEFGQVESRFANILNQKLLKAESRGEVELTRKELNTVKKFLLLEQMRVFVEEETCANFAKMTSDLQLKTGSFKYPFTEKIIENESVHDRWLRNIKVIIECKDLTSIQAHELCTYEAYRWAQIYNWGYMAIWDSSYVDTSFIITDIGMTSEREKSVAQFGLEVEKKQYLMEAPNRTTNTLFKQKYAELLYQQTNFHENFYMFSISKHRMLVVINPFFRLYCKKEKYPTPTIWPSKIKDRRLFEKNDADKLIGFQGKAITSDSDTFRYKVQSMKHEDVIWVNMLMLDRIDTLLGFTSLEDISDSVRAYDTWYKEHNLPPRKDYSALIELLK